MKRAVFSALFLGLLGAVAAVPASADSTIYSSGPGVNNTTNFDAWNISSPFIVTNSFTLFGNSNVTGTTFDVWLSPGDAISSVDWSFGNVAQDLMSIRRLFQASMCRSLAAPITSRSRMRW